MIIRFMLASTVALVLATGCSTSQAPKKDDRPTPKAEDEVQAVAERIIELVNARRYGEIFDLFAAHCIGGLTRDQLIEDWEQFGGQIGDADFRLELVQFAVNSISGDRAEVTSQVVAHTASRDLLMGNAEDPFFDVFIRDGGIWKAADRSC